MIYFNESVVSESADDAWLSWYNKLLSDAEPVSSRDGDVVGEVINATTIIIDPRKCIMKNKVRNMSIKYAIGEMLWYISANNKLSEIKKYSSAWDRMSDDGLTVNSNYGYCIKKKFGFNQWDFIKNLLTDNPQSRQAIIHIKTADDKKSKDVNCTVCLQFFIRKNKLYLTTYMRSNDLWMGFPYDVFQFAAMQVLMSMELGLELGTYTHIAGSLHLYARDVRRNDESINE